MRPERAASQLQIYPQQEDPRELRCTAGPAPWAGAYDLTGEAYDFPLSGRPKLFYLVATSRRSGSTYFCHKLWETGVLGAPMEYFSLPHVMLELSSRLGVTTPNDYLDAILARRTSSNGVFGMKVMVEHLATMGMMSVRCRTPHVIFLRRRDIVAQAVSFIKAMQTRRWNSFYPETGFAPVYKFNLILHGVRKLQAETKSWEKWFAAARIAPVSLFYEDFVQAPDRIVGEILARFGVAPDPERRIALPPVERQGDSISKEWVERFREEAAQQSMRLD